MKPVEAGRTRPLHPPKGTYFLTTSLLAPVLTLLLAAGLADFLTFFTVFFDVTVDDVCAAGAAGLAAGVVCAAKVKGKLAAVRAIANKVVFIVFLPAGSFLSPAHNSMLRFCAPDSDSLHRLY
jgi:hypothetical protein